MQRGEICAFDWAGITLGIEVPEGIDPVRDWNLPEGMTPLASAPAVEDVRISVGLDAPPAIPGRGTTWFHEGDVFEAGGVGADHWIRLGDGRFASADATFRWVHVSAPPTCSRDFPLAQPLDDLILIHRALDQGAFALRGTAAVRGEEALVILGGPASGLEPGGAALWQGWLLLQPEASGVRVVPLPSTTRAGQAGRAPRRVMLRGLHVLEAATSCEDAVCVLDPDSAAAELLRYAFAPIAAVDPDALVENATRIARQARVLQLRAPSGERFCWQSGPVRARALLPAGA
jgi:hypothetical protein